MAASVRYMKNSFLQIYQMNCRSLTSVYYPRKESIGVSPLYAKCLSSQASAGIDIGLQAPPAGKQTSKERSTLLKEQRKNLELEKEARHKTLEIPLDDVWREWELTAGPHQVKVVAQHYNIFQDLFDGAEFSSYMPVRIHYECKDGGYMPVCRGNTITPSEAMKQPLINYSCDDDTLWTLLMTNPDGHLLDNESEYVHWLIGNIPGDDLSNGEVLFDYLPVFPPKGTGYHRIVYILFKQEEKIDFKDTLVSLPCRSLKERTFKTLEFYRRYQDVLLPAGLHFAQCRWDSSVKNVFHNILDMREPIFKYDAPKIHVLPQKKWPHKKTVNYLKQYLPEE